MRRDMSSKWPMPVALQFVCAMCCFAANTPAQQQTFRANFGPAFLPPSTISVTRDASGATLKITVEKESASAPVGADVAKEFFSGVESIKRVPGKKEEGFDGCAVALTLSANGHEEFASNVWSPTKETQPTELEMIRALYNLITKTHIPSPQAEYLELLFGYFEGVQPRWKVIGGDPYMVRLYARLTADDIPAFRELVGSFPLDRQVIIDITNLESTGTLFYDEFLRATRQNPRLKWRAGDEWSEVLVKTGIPPDRIIRPTYKTPRPETSS